MLGNFLIGLWEGPEAALVVSILVAFLVRTDRRRKLPEVWFGVGVAVAVSAGVTAGLALAQQQLTFEAQEAFGGTLSIIAVGFVTWMIFWMRRAARSIPAGLCGRMEDAVRLVLSTRSIHTRGEPCPVCRAQRCAPPCRARCSP